jgi:hypothetical protein
MFVGGFLRTHLMIWIQWKAIWGIKDDCELCGVEKDKRHIMLFGGLTCEHDGLGRFRWEIECEIGVEELVENWSLLTQGSIQIKCRKNSQPSTKNQTSFTDSKIHKTTSQGPISIWRLMKNTFDGSSRFHASTVRSDSHYRNFTTHSNSEQIDVKFFVTQKSLHVLIYPPNSFPLAVFDVRHICNCSSSFQFD